MNNDQLAIWKEVHLLRILFIGDIVGKPGREAIKRFLKPLQLEHKIDVTIANGENAAAGKGLTKEKLIHQMDSALKFPGVANIWTQPIINRIDMLSTGIRTQVGIKIFGEDIKKLEEIADQIKRIVEKVKGAEDVYAERITGKPYLEIILKREELARYNLTVKEVQEVIEMAIGGENLTQIIEGR